MNRLSKVFRPFTRPPQNKILKKIVGDVETHSKAYKLLLHYGIINRSSPGIYHVLPMGQRIIDKLTRLIDREMKAIGAEKMSIPFLTSQHLWEKSDTYDKSKDELFHITDRSNHKFLLGPTHEQSFSNFIAQHILSYRDYPKLLYQITPKFRDEIRPNLGMLRSKEFLMKDLYSFDVDEMSAAYTYDRVTAAYDAIFNALGLPFYKLASGNDQHLISKSHEYFYFNDIGGDHLYHCHVCNEISSAVSAKEKNRCPHCLYVDVENQYIKGMEIAHTFSFETSYSTRLGSYYVDKNNKRQPLYMCSYGIGVSRLLSAIPELTTTDECELRWPLHMAPYLVCIIPPKAGSREEIAIELILPELYEDLECVPSLKDDLIIDDRTEHTIGKRLLDAKLFGFPFILVMGKDAASNMTPVFELHDVLNQKCHILPRSSLIQVLIEETECLTQKRTVKHYIAGNRLAV